MNRVVTSRLVYRGSPGDIGGSFRWALASRLSQLAGIGLLLGILCPSTLAQQSPPVSDSSREAALSKLEALQKQIEQLQGEIAALKKQLSPESEPTTPPAASPQVSLSAAEVTAAPASPSSKERSLLGPIDLSGFVDAYYGYNLNHPASRLSNMRAFDAPDNQFSLNLAELVLSKTPDPSNSRLGFRLSLGFGNAMNAVNAAEPGGPEFDRYLQEAYLSYLAPVGRGLQVDAGKFVTPLGFEVIETKEDWNYSRGLLFTYAVPFYHMGLRAKYAFNDTYSLTGYLVNGWDNVVDDNTGKTYGLSFAWTPNQKFTLSQNYMTGPEQPDSNHGWRSLSDTVISYSPTPRLSLALNYDYGSGDREPASGRPVVWTGVASYIRYAFNERYALATRYEYFDDVDGFRTGTAQHVNEFTTTFERRLARDLIVRLEFRRDVANEPSFLKGDLPVKTQNTLMGGLTYVFDAPESHYEARLTGGAATVTPASSVLRATALSAWRRDVMFICLLSPSALAGELANSKGA
jgi:hypothetical protein